MVQSVARVRVVREYGVMHEGARVGSGAREVHEYGVVDDRCTSTSGAREVHEYGVVHERCMSTEWCTSGARVWSRE